MHDPGGVRLGPPPFTGQWGGGASGFEVAPAPPVVIPTPPVAPRPPVVIPTPPVALRPPVLVPPVPLAPPLGGGLGEQPPSGSTASPFGQLGEKMSSDLELHPVPETTQQIRNSLDVADIVPFWTRRAGLARR